MALFAVAAVCALPAAAYGSFPYQASDPHDYSTYRLAPGAPRPNDLDGSQVWMYAATPSSPASPLVADKRELNGVRGASVVDADGSAPQAWATTTGRPDVTIAVLDSGVMWNNPHKPLNDLRLKARLNAGELPLPNADRATSTDALVPSCSALAGNVGRRDLNDDGVFNILDYACDSRVPIDPDHGVGPKTVLDPEDVIIAFSDGTDADHNGYVDDIAGWDFLDDDNDPFDDVQYGHGSGEVDGSSGEADNANAPGGQDKLGSCPNCMVVPLRVGTSFIADVNAFALAALYATDNGVDVIQEALGTIDKSRFAADAIKYAYDHGTTVIASAADEAAQHHNWPSSYPYSIVVNSVTHNDTGPVDSSYLEFNGCTNFSSRVTLAIPSVSCSSDATGRGAGMAGLVYSAALNAIQEGKLAPSTDCTRVDGTPCPITPNEVRQLMASGTFGGVQAADDVDFAQDPASGGSTETSCGGQPGGMPGCTDPFAPLGSQFPGITVPFRYPARRGHDQFYGYGRANTYHSVSWVDPASGNAHVPPEVEVTSPTWFEMVDSTRSSFDVKAQVFDRGRPYTCTVYIAPGAYPKDTAAPDGDFVKYDSGVCDGTTQHTDRVDGVVANVKVADLKALFPANAGDFTGTEGGTTGQTPNPGGNVGRPNDEPYSFVVKVIATTANTAPASTLTGTDRSQAYLHHDADLLPGFPKQLPGDIEASPVLADLDGDNRNELVIANSDGIVHAYRRDGSELPGWPFHTDKLTDHPGSHALASGAVQPGHAAVLATPAVGDIDHDGTLEVVVADMQGEVYVVDGQTGTLERKMHTNPAFSGAPLHPFENVRGAGPDGKWNPAIAVLYRTQRGFIGAPVLADLDQNDGGRLEIVAAALDRHVYAWNDDGSDVPGWPLVVADRSKLRAQQPQFDPVTQRPFFDPAKAPGDDILYDQGAIVDTPAVGDIDGDGKPEVVVGTNENYQDGTGGESFNGGGVNTGLYSVLGQALALANGRLYAIRSTGDPDGDPNTGPDPWLPGWPFKVGILEEGVLPLVGEGITGNPVIGNVPCQGVTRDRRVGVMPAAGVAYVVNKDGQSCYGRDPGGHDIALNTEGGAGSDQPVLAAFGHPAFAELAGGTAFLAPAAGVQRAADVVLPEYQGGQDYLVAWDLQQPQGNIKQGWPATTNDLQFLTGPSVGDISPVPGEEVIEGSAHHDFQGITSVGAKAPGWPKLSGDWAVANPAIGSFGQLETDKDASRVVVDGTRNGRLVAYDTGAAVCGPASWPQFHHDPANSGDLDRDAVSPGKPEDAAVDAGKLTFTSPGDDLLCGKAKSYEVRTSGEPITPSGFAGADKLDVTGAVEAPGAKAALTLPQSGLRRYVAVRAVDDQGNVGIPAVVDTGSSATGGQGSSSPSAPAAGPAPTSRDNSGVLADHHGCLPRRMAFKSRGLGAIRLGDNQARVLAHVGRPPTRNKAGTVWTYCVRGGGEVALVFVRGYVRMIASTARGHEAIGHAGPGDRISKLHRTYPGSSRFGRGIFFTHRSSRIVFEVRRGRVRVAAVADRRAMVNPRLLRRYLGLAGL